MLNGKAWPKAVRGFRMVATALLAEYLEAEVIPESMQSKLEEARQKPLGKLWIDCLIMPVWLALLFIRAEREANWLLHLYCVKQMIPYFFVAAHWNYAKYSTWYLSEMKALLPKEAQDMFLREEHVCLHED